jgi:hypothetical protein
LLSAASRWTTPGARSTAGQYYNEAVLADNNAIAVFPPSIVAGVFGLRARESFHAGGEERGTVRVEF